MSEEYECVVGGGGAGDREARQSVASGVVVESKQMEVHTSIILFTPSEIESLLNMSDSPSNWKYSIDDSLYLLQLQILKDQQNSIQSTSLKAESLLIEAYHEILSVPQQRRLQIQSQKLYTLRLLAKLSSRPPGSTLIMTHLRSVVKGRSDSVADHIGLLRIRQSLYGKLEEKEVSSCSTVLSDFEWTTIQVAQHFLEEGDFASTLETLISASHRCRISTHFVQEMGSIVAKLSASKHLNSDFRISAQNHLMYNLECFGPSEQSALLSSIALLKMKTGTKDNKSQFYEEIYSLLLNAVQKDSENKQAWFELSSFLFSLSQSKADLPFVKPEYLVATIISALRLDTSNTSLLISLLNSVKSAWRKLSEEVFKLIELIPLHTFIPYLYILFLPRSPFAPITHRLVHSLLSVYPELACFYLEWNQSAIAMDFGSLFSFLPDRVRCNVVCS